MYEGKKLVTPETKQISRTETKSLKNRKVLGGLVVESAEGVRFAYAATQVPKPEREGYHVQIQRSRIRNALGRIIPKIDPVVNQEKFWMNGYWETEQTHKSGRISRINRLNGAIFIPTAEWVDPYADLSDEEKVRMVKQFEAPPIPGLVEGPTKKEA